MKDILQNITDRVIGDPEAAKEFFGLKRQPGAKWLQTIEPGVAAAQKTVDEDAKAQPAPDTAAGGKPDEFAEDFGIKDETAPKPAPAVAVVGDQGLYDKHLDALRAKLRVAPDADIGVVLAAINAGAWARRVMMLTPLATPILPWVHFAHMAQLRVQPWLGYYQETDTLIQRARNLCAQAFLKSESEWSWWVDGDIVPSWGDPAFFYDVKRLGIPEGRIPQEYLRQKALERLLVHGKTIVGSVYQQRRVGGKVCSPIDLRPGNDEAVRRIRRGPRNELLEVEWCATGCLLVHRSVYQDIQKANPDRAPQAEGEPWDFFGHDVARMGEDAAFGLMAARAGHKSYLDLGCWTPHVGNFAFTPEPI